jgi:hypothetical protein
MKTDLHTCVLSAVLFSPTQDPAHALVLGLSALNCDMGHGASGGLNLFLSGGSGC